MDITFDLKSISIDGEELEMCDGMYCLTHFLTLLKKKGLFKEHRIEQIRQRKSFVDNVYAIYGDKIKKRPNIVSAMKEAGVYKAIGRRDEMRIYCSRSIMLALMLEYSKEVYSATIKGLFK